MTHYTNSKGEAVDIATAGLLVETWRPAPDGGDIYEVSNFGRVRNGGRTLTPFLCGRYLAVTMCVGGERRRRYVHLLVLAAFVCPRPPGTQGAHGDGNPGHNMLANLRWATPRDNAADKFGHHTQPTGERHPRTTLTIGEVRVIRTSQERARALARQYAVSHATIHNIQQGKTWAYD